MGVPGLWNALDCSKEQFLLSEVAAIDPNRLEGPLFPFAHEGTLTVGVDIPLWINAAVQAFNIPIAQGGRQYQRGPNAELKLLFRRILRYLQVNVNLIFVFDGPNRPQVKRNTNVRPKEHYLTKPLSEVILALGFHVHMAPGEAEAELARLNKEGYIDAIITGDSDTFVFGAKYIIRDKPSANDDIDPIDVYPSHSLCEAGFDDPSVKLIALLVGGDYSDGLPGCGIGLATQLASTSLGQDLCNFARNSTVAELNQYLEVWRASLCNVLLHNSDGILKKKHPSVARNVTSAFLTADIVMLYLKPATSFSDNAGPLTFTRNTWAPKFPDIHLVSRWCQKNFTWATKIRFWSELTPDINRGIGFRRLLHHQHPTDESKGLFPLDLFRFDPQDQLSRTIEKPRYKLYRVYFSHHGLKETLTSNLEEDPTGAVPQWMKAQGTIHARNTVLLVPEPIFKKTLLHLMTDNAEGPMQPMPRNLVFVSPAEQPAKLSKKLTKSWIDVDSNIEVRVDESGVLDISDLDSDTSDANDGSDSEIEVVVLN